MNHTHSSSVVETIDQAARDPAEAASEQEALAALRQQVDELPTQQQEVLRLRLQDQLSYKQIAEVTGLSVSNVGYHIHQAVATLRRKISLTTP